MLHRRILRAVAQCGDRLYACVHPYDRPRVRRRRHLAVIYHHLHLVALAQGRAYDAHQSSLSALEHAAPVREAQFSHAFHRYHVVLTTLA